MNIKELRKIGDKIGRAGMGDLARKAIEEYDGSYKQALELCGKLEVIARMSTCDHYWNEQVTRGKLKMEDAIENINFTKDNQ